MWVERKKKCPSFLENLKAIPFFMSSSIFKKPFREKQVLQHAANILEPSLVCFFLKLPKGREDLNSVSPFRNFYGDFERV